MNPYEVRFRVGLVALLMLCAGMSLGGWIRGGFVETMSLTATLTQAGAALCAYIPVYRKHLRPLMKAFDVEVKNRNAAPEDRNPTPGSPAAKEAAGS